MTDEQLEPLALDLGVPVESLPHTRARFNIAPTDEHFIVRKKAEQAEIRDARWGLVNFWAKDSKRAAQQINARAETLTAKSAFREAFESRRCIVPADGFYEWTGPKENRQPLWFHRPEGGLVYFAGLYEAWRPKPGEWQLTFTIVTTEANELLSKYHDRMPVILSPDGADAWMDPRNTDTVHLQKLLVPAAEGVLVARPVSKKVNNVRYQEPDAIDEEPLLGLG